MAEYPYTKKTSKAVQTLRYRIRKQNYSTHTGVQSISLAFCSINTLFVLFALPNVLN